MAYDPNRSIQHMRETLDQFESSRALSLAATKLDELEMWLRKAAPKAGQPAMTVEEPVHSA